MDRMNIFQYIVNSSLVFVAAKISCRFLNNQKNTRIHSKA